MSRYIPLHRSVTRCRPQPPLSQLHNDCGMQHSCARRVAANIHGDATQDFSIGCTAYGTYMHCSRFVAMAEAEQHRDSPTPARPMQEPDC